MLNLLPIYWIKNVGGGLEMLFVINGVILLSKLQGAGAKYVFSPPHIENPITRERVKHKRRGRIAQTSKNKVKTIGIGPDSKFEIGDVVDMHPSILSRDHSKGF